MQRRFFNPSQPQTLQGAVFLLYANVVVALLFRSGGEGIYAAAVQALTPGTNTGGAPGFIGTLLAIAVVVGSGAAAYLIANEKKIGWRIGVVVAAMPVLAILIIVIIGRVSIIDVMNAFGLSLLFDVALLVLLLHDQTRSYEKIWFK